MDWLTVGWLAPYAAMVVLFAMAAVSRHDPGGYAALGAVVFVVWSLAVAVAGVHCVWEGFADGPLPVQCRAAAHVVLSLA